MSLTKKRKLKIEEDQKRAQTAIRNRRNQMLNKTDEIESAMNSDRSLAKYRQATAIARHNPAVENFIQPILLK